MDHYRNGDRPTRPGDPAYFTGSVSVDPIVEAPEPARVRALRVAFAPGARTNWHTHPLGQTLYVLHGTGLFQTEGEAIQVIRAGDTIWIPPHERHWHGAAPETAMTHIAIQEALDGSNVTWQEPVSDDDYTAR
ncbi:MAG: cupin domain-containing protein [Pseudomonadota bacterium]